jgi:hypothetical protein
MTVAVTLLGPQRRPTLDRVVHSLGVDGPIATVTAGWQDREAEDTELAALLDGRAENLRLHARWLEVLHSDQEYARVEREHRSVLDELQQYYVVRLDHALQAAADVAQRPDGHPRTRAMAVEDALATVRLIDATHLGRVRELHDAFLEAWHPEERDVIATHRAEVRDVLSRATCLVVAGGHVGVLLRVMRLFGVGALLPPRVIAWSAGAMTLAERVVLFHDRVAQGTAQTEMFDEGLGVVPGLVLLPHARRRLRTDDLSRMSLLARRFEPALCLVLDDGVRLDLGEAGSLPAEARVVEASGRIVEIGAA